MTNSKTKIFAKGITQTKSAITINSRPLNVNFSDRSNIQTVGRQTVSETRVTIGVRNINVDPVSQSFFVDPETYTKGMYVTSIDLYFRTKSRDNNRNVTVEIREMLNGYPSPEVIGLGDKAVVNNVNINISEDATEATTFTFKNPIYLGAGNEYCFTIKPEANDPDYAIWVAELGEKDITDPQTSGRIEAAYGAGVLFTSSNDRTWTARQNLDVKFTIKVAEFSTTSKVAYWNNVPVTNGYTYSALQSIIGDQILSDTNIVYEIKATNESNLVDESWTEIKNYERLILSSKRQIANTTIESAEGFNSLQLRATLSTTNKYITPYVDNEHIRFAFSENIINNALSTDISGTVTFTSGTNYVVGNGTDFANDVFAGEYLDFGDEYRKVESITNATYLTVTTDFTTSNTTSQAISSRNEENPSGPYTSDSRYVTRTVTLNDGFEASDLVTYLRVNRPPGTGIRVYAKLLNENDGDSFADKFYIPMTLDGTETFTLNSNEYKEEKYIMPTTVKTGGSELLSGTVQVGNTTTNVIGTSTRFLEDLKIGDTIAVGASRIERVVSTIANNTFLTVESAFSANASSQDVYKVLNNQVAYTTPDGRTFNGFKYFAVKVVFISSNDTYTPKVKDLRTIALA